MYFGKIYKWDGVVKKILVSVMADRKNKTSIRGMECIRSNWMSQNYDNVEIETYYGLCENNKNYDFRDDEVVVNVEESLPNVFYKTLEYLETILEKDFDFFYRTSSSCYVHIERLRSYIEKQPTTNFVGGIEGFYGNYRFFSGGGFILSRDLVEYIVENKNKIPYIFVDDVSIGNFVLNKNPIFKQLPRINFRNGRWIEEGNLEMIDECWHWYVQTAYNCEHLFGELWNEHRICG